MSGHRYVSTLGPVRLGGDPLRMSLPMRTVGGWLAATSPSTILTTASPTAKPATTTTTIGPVLTSTSSSTKPTTTATNVITAPATSTASPAIPPAIPPVGTYTKVIDASTSDGGSGASGVSYQQPILEPAAPTPADPVANLESKIDKINSAPALTPTPPAPKQEPSAPPAGGSVLMLAILGYLLLKGAR